MWCIKEPHL